MTISPRSVHQKLHLQHVYHSALFHSPVGKGDTRSVPWMDVAATREKCVKGHYRLHLEKDFKVGFHLLIVLEQHASMQHVFSLLGVIQT